MVRDRRGILLWFDTYIYIISFVKGLVPTSSISKALEENSTREGYIGLMARHTREQIQKAIIELLLSPIVACFFVVLHSLFVICVFSIKIKELDTEWPWVLGSENYRNYCYYTHSPRLTPAIYTVLLGFRLLSKHTRVICLSEKENRNRMINLLSSYAIWVLFFMSMLI